MLNNFCFHVLAQKSLFKVENVNVFFDINGFFWQNFMDSSNTLSCDIRVHRAGSQLKNVWKSDKSWEPEKNLKIWKLKRRNGDKLKSSLYTGADHIDI